MSENEKLDTIAVPRSQFAELVRQNEEYKAQETIIVDCVFSAMQLLNICDEKRRMNKELQEKKNYFKVIIKAITSKISISSLIMGSKSAEEDIKKHFGFLTSLKPIIEKHAAKHQQSGE